MDKTSKDLSLLYESIYKGTYNGSSAVVLNESFGSWAIKVFNFLTGKGEGTPGIINKFLVIRKLGKVHYDRYRNLNTLKDTIGDILKRARATRNTAARQAFYRAELQRIQPLLNQLEISPTVLNRSFQTNRLENDLINALNTPVQTLINTISRQTGIPGPIIDGVLNEPSINTAKKALDDLMPTVQNIGRSALFWTALYAAIQVSIEVGATIIAWAETGREVAESTRKAAKAAEQGARATGEAMETTASAAAGIANALNYINSVLEDWGLKEPTDNTQQPPSTPQPNQPSQPITPATPGQDQGGIDWDSI